MFDKNDVFDFFSQPENVYASLEKASQMGSALLKEQKKYQKNSPEYHKIQEEVEQIESVIQRIQSQISFMKKG